MNFYWITRLDAINTALMVVFVLSLIVCLICIMIYFIDKYQDGGDNPSMRKALWVLATVIIISALGAIFIPTTKQMCAIYFVEYLQENEDAKQLPDKAIKAANAYFDELIEDKNKTK